SSWSGCSQDSITPRLAELFTTTLSPIGVRNIFANSCSITFLFPFEICGNRKGSTAPRCREELPRFLTSKLVYLNLRNAALPSGSDWSIVFWRLRFRRDFLDRPGWLRRRKLG